MGVALLIGYTQYGRFLFNTCEEVVRELDGSSVGGLRIAGLLIPVSLKFVKERLPKIIESYWPKVVVGLGMAPGWRRVVVEMVATNLLTFETPDVDGYVADHEELYPGEPTFIEIPTPRSLVLEECVRKRRLSIKLGISVGTYMCNALAYTIARYGTKRGVPAAFLHIPMHSNYAMRNRFEGFAAPIREIVECVKCVLEACSKQVEAGSRSR